VHAIDASIRRVERPAGNFGDRGRVAFLSYHHSLDRRSFMIDAKRRILLKGSLAAGAVGVAVGAGLLAPRAVLAAWPEAAFTATDVKAAIKSLLGVEAGEPGGDITIKAPEIAENGAVVQVSVDSNLAGVKRMVIIAEGNQNPLIASFDLGEDALPSVTTRIKMGKTANVQALVQTADKTFTASKEVKVTIGGCGG
jgi:sulfur-oxidizing protein SoxY